MSFYIEEPISTAVVFIIGGNKKTGKTHALRLLSNCPEFNPMGVLDTENGTKFERTGFSEKSMIRKCDSVASALKIIRELIAKKNSFGLKSLAIDSGTGLWKGLQLAFEEQEAVGKSADKDLVNLRNKNVNAWTKIKSPYGHLMALIMKFSTDFNVHIFITAHEGKIFEGNNAVGEKSKLEATTEYFADVSLRIIKKNNKRTIEPDYDRSRLLRSGMPLTTKLFQDIVTTLEDKPHRDAADVAIEKDKQKQARPKPAQGESPCTKCGVVVKDSVLASTLKQVQQEVCWSCLKQIVMEKNK